MKEATLVLAIICLILHCPVNGDDICQEVTGKQKSFRVHIPKDFTVDVEIVSEETGSVQNMKLYYSTANKIVRMDVLENSVLSSMYFYYQDNQILIFNFFDGRGDCRVIDDLANAVDDFLFEGVRTSNGVDARIPVPLAALHLIGKSGFQDNKIIHEYVGTRQVRGKKASAYSSCQKWRTESNDIVLNVTHYFADQKYKFPYAEGVTTLLSIEVEGTGTIKGKADRHIRHIYNYFNFETGIEITSDILETPDGITCPGRLVDESFPLGFPEEIRLHAETVDHINKVVVNTEESYNFKNLYAVIQSKSVSFPDTVLTILDFKTNKVYVMDVDRSSCKKTMINETMPQSELPLYTLKGGKAIMSNPRTFFYADATDFAYLGKKKIRGMMTDSWVARTKNLNHFPDAVVQWYFVPVTQATPSNDGTKNQWPTPVKMTFWPDVQYEKGITRNLFHVDYTHHFPDVYDVAPCFNNTRFFQLVLTATRDDIYSTGVEGFLREATQEISRIAQVDHFKVNQMKLYYSEKEVFLHFAISDDSDLIAETSRVHNATDSKLIKLHIMDSKTKNKKSVIVHKALSTSVGDTSTQRAAKDQGDDGYSSGSMAGLGVAMTLIGLASGVGAGVFHSRYYSYT